MKKVLNLKFRFRSFLKKSFIFSFLVLFSFQSVHALLPASETEAQNQYLICLNANKDKLSVCKVAKHNLAVFQSDGYKTLNQNAIILQQDYKKCLNNNGNSQAVVTACQALQNTLTAANVSVSNYLTQNLIKADATQAEIDTKLDINYTFNLNSSSNPNPSLNPVNSQTDNTKIQSGLASDCANRQGGCNFDDLKSIYKGLVQIVLGAAVILVIVMVSLTIFRFWFAKESEQTAALVEAKDRISYAVFGFIIIFIIASGILFALYQSLGINKDIIEPLKNFLSSSFVETAYAVVPNQDLLVPNVTKIDNIYDLFVALGQTVVRWVFFPLIVYFWFHAGFAFVYARGNPEALKSARKRLLYTFIGTVIIMMLQGLMMSLQETIRSWFSK